MKGKAENCKLKKYKTKQSEVYEKLDEESGTTMQYRTKESSISYSSSRWWKQGHGRQTEVYL